MPNQPVAQPPFLTTKDGDHVVHIVAPLPGDIDTSDTLAVYDAVIEWLTVQREQYLKTYLQ
jgi:hypothetical protein